MSLLVSKLSPAPMDNKYGTVSSRELGAAKSGRGGVIAILGSRIKYSLPVLGNQNLTFTVLKCLCIVSKGGTGGQFICFRGVGFFLIQALSMLSRPPCLVHNDTIS